MADLKVVAPGKAHGRHAVSFLSVPDHAGKLVRQHAQEGT